MPLSFINKKKKEGQKMISNTLILSFLIPVLASLLIYNLDPFYPVAIPSHELSILPPLPAPVRNSFLLNGSEKINVGSVGPEDLAYDSVSGVLYTGCADGWIKRVRVNDSVVEDWVNTGGRPLGLVLGHHGVIVADAYKGLLKITKDGIIEQLTNQAEGVDFLCTDGVDVAKNGIIYFTDASSKYSLNEFIYDALEGRPNGRLLSYDPSTKETKVLVRDLYFANGVAVSPDQTFVVFSETPMLRCKRYFIEGEKKGSVEKFGEKLPGLPDNIRSDGQGHFLIALAVEHSLAWELILKYPSIRKIMAIMEKYSVRPSIEKNAGIFVVDTQGKPIAHYSDPGLAIVTAGITIGGYLYCGSIGYPYIIRVNLIEHPAIAST